MSYQLRLPNEEEDRKCQEIVDRMKAYDHPEAYSGAYKTMFNVMVKGEIDMTMYLSNLVRNWIRGEW